MKTQHSQWQYQRLPLRYDKQQSCPSAPVWAVGEYRDLSKESLVSVVAKGGRNTFLVSIGDSCFFEVWSLNSRISSMAGTNVVDPLDQTKNNGYLKIYHWEAFRRESDILLIDKMWTHLLWILNNVFISYKYNLVVGFNNESCGHFGGRSQFMLVHFSIVFSLTRHYGQLGFRPFHPCPGSASLLWGREWRSLCLILVHPPAAFAAGLSPEEPGSYRGVMVAVTPCVGHSALEAREVCSVGSVNQLMTHSEASGPDPCLHFPGQSWSG